jgi:glucose/arabinose dehydrogenase
MRFTQGAAPGVLGVWLAASVAAVAGGQSLPGGFDLEVVASGFDRPVDLEFAADGRMFVAEQRGIVWVVEDGVTLAQPFVDLRDEVNGVWDRGLLGLALDPDFLANRNVYLLYTVDPIFGKPDEPPQSAAWGRVVRYTGTAGSNGNEADLASRLVLIGDTAPEGIPVCEPSHTVGSLRFGHDGSLFVSAGDGAHFDQMDDGGNDPDCFVKGMFPEVEDIGAFRSQYLGSLAGKILRIDPATGLGLDTNPHWTGDGADNKSRVWVNGARNPYRFAVRPDTALGGGPGTLYIGDVGWFAYEETSAVNGGENMGWPCREGFEEAPLYSSGEPAHSGCDSIETPENPGPLTDPVIAWHHSVDGLSFPPVFQGNCAAGTVFYTGACYPPPFDSGLFQAEHIDDWIKVLETDESAQFVALHDFGSGFGGPVDLAVSPDNGDLHVVELNFNRILRISYDAGVVGDLTGDCQVSTADLLALLSAWGPCDACPEDLDGNGSVGTSDLLMLLANWS